MVQHIISSCSVLLLHFQHTQSLSRRARAHWACVSSSPTQGKHRGNTGPARSRASGQTQSYYYAKNRKVVLFYDSSMRSVNRRLLFHMVGNHTSELRTYIYEFGHSVQRHIPVLLTLLTRDVGPKPHINHGVFSASPRKARAGPTCTS